MKETQTGKVIKIEEKMGSFGRYSIIKVRGEDGKMYSYFHGLGYFNHNDGEDHEDEFEEAPPVDNGETVNFEWEFDKTGKYRNITNFI